MPPRAIRRLTTLILMALALAACAAYAQSPPVDDTPDPTITSGAAQRALDSAKAKWAASKVTNYQVRVALSCFCAESIRKPRTLTVRRGSPIRPPAHLKNVATVPRMFKVISDSIRAGVASLMVTYGSRGVPRSISIDRSRQIADEESYYTIDRFKRLRWGAAHL